MFGKLKEKLKGALSAFSKKVDEEADETIEEVVEKKESPKKEKNPPKKETPKTDSKPTKKDKSASEKKSTKDKSKKKPEVEKPIKEEVEQVEILSEPKTTKENVDPIKDNTSDAIAKKEKAIHQEAKDLEKEIELEKDKKAVEEIEDPILKEDAKNQIQVEEDRLEEDIQAQEKEIESIQEPEKKKGFFGKLFGKKEAIESTEKEEQKTPFEPETTPISEEVTKEELIETKDEETKEKKGLFSKVSEAITKKKISANKFEELFQELEMILLENNTSFDVVEKIKEDLAKDIVDKPLPRNEIDSIILSSLKSSIESLFDVKRLDLLQESENKKPLIISFIGVNGSGKTTQLAKVAKYFQNQGKSVVMAAGDTFRAAAIQQLEEHANNLGVKLIKHNYGADAAAVCFDAIEHAKAKDMDVVLLDTAGRLHSNSNLMEELHKVIRVAKPDFNIFVGESITGNDCIFQAEEFGKAVDIHGIILTKADVDEKGGTAISISHVTGKPIVFLGNGQGYDDLEVFDKEKLLKNLGL